MSLIEKMMRGCIYIPKRWSGDCGEMSSVDESKTDELLEQAAQRLWKLEAALERIRDRAWGESGDITAAQEIAREALE